MNICFVSSEYPTADHKGGIATYTEKTARALARRDLNVSVITEGEEPALVRVEEGVRVIPVMSPRTRPRIVGRALAVDRALRALPLRPDIVQSCEYRAEAVAYALRQHRGSRLVTRLATPSFLVGQLNGELNGGAWGWTRNRLERLQTRRSDAIISPTQALADIVSEQWGIGRDHIRIIRTGVDFAARYASQEAELPPELTEHEYIIYFGRLEERKGVHILAQALPRVMEARPQLHVVFVGEVQEYRGMPMRSFIDGCAGPYRDRLHFFPRVGQRELYPLLSGALCAVLPSIWENLANTCLEALDVGKPVIATQGCGFGEVVEHGQSGLLVPPGHVMALEQAMLSLLSNQNLLERFSIAAKERAAHFALHRTVDDLFSFYQSLLQSPVRRLRVSSTVSRHYSSNSPRGKTVS